MVDLFDSAVQAKEGFNSLGRNRKIPKQIQWNLYFILVVVRNLIAIQARQRP